MIVLAKSAEGAEYLYSAKSAHAVPKSSARKIMDALNDARYDLRDGQVWHIHEVGGLDDASFYAERQSFGIRKGSIYERR